MYAKRALLIGIDGAGNFARHANMPHLDALRARGNWTWDAQAVLPTISAECWGAILYGVMPEVHGLTNDIASQTPMRSDFPHASIFQAMERAGATKEQMHSIVGWSPIQTGILGAHTPATLFTGDDEAITRRVEAIVGDGAEFRLMFLQMDGTDGAGHTHGYGTPVYLRYLERVDGMIGRMVAALRAAGKLEDTLIVVTADHGGGGGNPKSHGTAEPMDRDVMFVAAGPGAPVGEREKAPSIVEIPGMVLTALGVALPEGMRAAAL